MRAERLPGIAISDIGDEESTVMRAVTGGPDVVRQPERHFRPADRRRENTADLTGRNGGAEYPHRQNRLLARLPQTAVRNI
jgi:hypothetical protein